MKLGNLTFNKPVFLAPMAGYTNLPCRLMAKEMGADIVVSEMISAKGLFYRDKKTNSLLQTHPEEAPLGVQIFGSEEKVLEEVMVKYLNALQFFYLDFNAGCPVPKVVKNGEGSALLGKPDLFYRLMKTLVKTSNKPVMPKIRIGLTQDDICLEQTLELLQKAGVAGVTVHGRTREQYYTGTADWKLIGLAKKNCEIPLILSGDIKTAEDAACAFEETNCDGIMIGRGAIGNPFIFREIKAKLCGDIKLELATPEEKLSAAISHTRKLGLVGNNLPAVKEMSKHIVAYTKGLVGSNELRAKIFTTKSAEDIIALLWEYGNKNYGVDLSTL